MPSPKRHWLGLVSLASLAACSTLVGADFDDLKGHGPTPGDASGGDQSMGAAGNEGDGEGGANQGGAPSGSSGGAPQGGGPQGGSSGKGGQGGGAGSGGTADGGPSGGSDPGGSAGEGGDGGSGANTGVVVLNEVKGHGSDESDSVELYNAGPGSRDVGGYRIVDSGNNSFEFPELTLMPQGGYLLLQLVDENSGLELGGPFKCGTDAFICFRDSGWGIAQGGELVRLRNAAATLIDSTQYPGETSLQSDESWGRLPNGTGTFQATASTPETENIELP